MAHAMYMIEFNIRIDKPWFRNLDKTFFYNIYHVCLALQLQQNSI